MIGICGVLVSIPLIIAAIMIARKEHSLLKSIGLIAVGFFAFVGIVTVMVIVVFGVLFSILFGG